MPMVNELPNKINNNKTNNIHNNSFLMDKNYDN